jgi:exonuclease VII small subunit
MDNLSILLAFICVRCILIAQCQQVEVDPNCNPPESGGEVQPNSNADYNTKSQELQKLVQHLYMAQAQVQLEATEIQKAQSLAGSAQQNLEEATNNVKIITEALHQSQQTVAQAALRAQNAQLQLAAHDQLLFSARQKVDALSAQMVGLQVQLGIGENKLAINVADLLNQLNQPLRDDQKPKPIPSYDGPSGRQRRTGEKPVDLTCREQSVENQKYIDTFLSQSAPPDDTDLGPFDAATADY